MKFRLFHYWRSSCSWRVRWALTLKGVECEYVPVNLLSDEPESAEHLKRNPMGYVPALEILDASSRFLCESIAIIEYLEETIPRPALLPGNPFQRACIRQMAETINSGTQPLQNLNVFQLHSTDPAEQKKWNQHWIRKGLGAYEELAKSYSGRFSFGDTITLADLVLIPQCYNAKRQGLELNEFPLIERLFNHAMETESCRASAPERFQPAV